MKPTTKDIAKAALEAAFAALKEHGLEDEAAHLARDIRDELSGKASVVVATLTTPTGEAGDTAESVRASLEKKLGRPIEVIQKADKSLLGGAILEYGDERIDLSLKGALDNAKQQLEHASSH
jgi:F0F1-type ATP synthase delta subunit